MARKKYCKECHSMMKYHGSNELQGHSVRKRTRTVYRCPNCSARETFFELDLFDYSKLRDGISERIESLEIENQQLKRRLSMNDNHDLLFVMRKLEYDVEALKELCE